MKDTLHFVLKSDEEKFTFNGNEILEQIQEQKQNFIKRFGYEPKYIRIKRDIADYLLKQTLKIIRVEYPRTICGMEIKFSNDLGLDKCEAICV